MDEFYTKMKKQFDIHNGVLTPQICQEHGLKIFDELRIKKLRKLGKGGVGEVWMCMQVENREFVAVKYISVITEKAEKFASFMVEKEILQQISKKGTNSIAKLIGAFYDLDSNGYVQHLILVSETGDYSLDQLIKESEAKNKAFQPQEVLALISHLSEGFRILQELRIYHSDIKLANLIFSAKNTKFFIIDFGVSKLIPFNDKLLDEVSLEEYATGGTKGWCSPEKAYYWDCFLSSQALPQGRETFNPFKDDMWALGTCIEKILNKTAATYAGDKFLKIILSHLKDPDSQNRFDGIQLSNFLVQNCLTSLPPGSDCFKTYVDIAKELDIKRRKDVGFKEVFELLEKAFLPQEMLEVALEEYKSLVAKFGYPGMNNFKHFIGALGRVGSAYTNIGNYIKGLEFFLLERKALEWNDKLPEHEVNALFEEVSENESLGKDKETLNNNVEVLELREFDFKNEKQEEMLDNLHSIACVNGQLGHYHEALEQYERLLELQKKIFKTEEHPNICRTLSNIAALHGNMNSFQKALQLHEYILEIRKKIFKTEQHPEVCTTLYWIGEMHGNLGFFKNALEKLERVLEIRKNIFKTEEHQDVCITLNSIGSFNGCLGYFKKALKLHEKALEIQKKIFKTEEHPAICTTLTHIAYCTINLGWPQKALQEYEHILEIEKKIFKTEEHPNICSTLINIASISEQLGFWPKALQQYEHVLDIQKKIFMTKHLYLCKTLYFIANLRGKMGSNQEALEQLQQVLETQKKILKTDNHPDVLKTLQHITFQLYQLGRFREALANFRRSLKIALKLYKSENNPYVQDLFRNIDNMAFNLINDTEKEISKNTTWRMRRGWRTFRIFRSWRSWKRRGSWRSLRSWRSWKAWKRINANVDND